MANLSINQKDCLKIPIDRKLFKQNKIGLIIYGYNGGNFMAKGHVDEVKIFKKLPIDLQD